MDATAAAANHIAAQLDPKAVPDAARQAVAEGLAYGPPPKDPDLWRVLLPVAAAEPVHWIRLAELRAVRRVPPTPELTEAAAEWLGHPDATIRMDGAKLIRDIFLRFETEKKTAELSNAAGRILKALLARLDPGSPEPDAEVRSESYKILRLCGSGDEILRGWLSAVRIGDEAAYLNFGQYLQGRYPAEALGPLLAAYPRAHEVDTGIHLLRALTQTISKEGVVTGYPSTEELMEVLIQALRHPAEGVRAEAASVIGSRAGVARKQKTRLPRDNEAWNLLFDLYASKLPATTAPDRDRAKEALRVFPAEPERLTRIFDLLEKTTEETQKQSVVDLLGSLKTPETRAYLLKLLKEGFGRMKLEAQKATADAAAKFFPDAEMEAEMEKLLEGKGLHADILAKIEEKLFADLPTLKERIIRWITLDPKTKRPGIDRFELPLNHVKIVEAAKKRAPDPDLRRALLALEPYVLYSEVKSKLHETLKEFPGPQAPEPVILLLDQTASSVIAMIEPLARCRIHLEGFALPNVFGGSTQLEFGFAEQAQATGLSAGGAAMAKDFVKKALSDTLSGAFGDPLPAGSKFRVIAEAEDAIRITLLPPEPAAPPHP